MLVPCNLLIHFEDFRVAKEFVDSLITANNCAERGIKLIGDYKDSCFDIKERESLAQLVEHRSNFSISNISKEAIEMF
jgi:predicted transcriptional regulator